MFRSKLITFDLLIALCMAQDDGSIFLCLTRCIYFRLIYIIPGLTNPARQPVCFFFFKLFNLNEKKSNVGDFALYLAQLLSFKLEKKSIMWRSRSDLTLATTPAFSDEAKIIITLQWFIYRKLSFVGTKQLLIILANIFFSISQHSKSATSIIVCYGATCYRWGGKRPVWAKEKKTSD